MTEAGTSLQGLIYLRFHVEYSREALIKIVPNRVEFSAIHGPLVCSILKVFVGLYVQ